MLKSIDQWLLPYVRSVLRRPKVTGLKHLVFCVADHYEPFRGSATKAEALARVRPWVEQLPDMAQAFRDADGRAPQHTFFYPQEEYEPEVIEAIAGLTRAGLGEVEVHLHHRHDTAAGLTEKLNRFVDQLRGTHGLLGSWPDGRAAYGFIHGNWALNNSRPDGDWCGVDHELDVLAATGCYADFTFPSAPSPTQPRIVNELCRVTGLQSGRVTGLQWQGYRVTELQGGDVRRGVRECGSVGVADKVASAIGGRAGLIRPQTDTPTPPHVHPHPLLITGPLALNWRRRKWGVLPRIENGEISGANPMTPARIDQWVRQHIHVHGRPDCIFVKVYTHGCVPANADTLLGEVTRQAHEYLQRQYNDGRQWKLHYVTAREMYNLARAAEDGRPGDPGTWREYEVAESGA